jgi:hypothetical protein
MQSLCSTAGLYCIYFDIGEGIIYEYSVNTPVQIYYNCINTNTYKLTFISFHYIIIITIQEDKLFVMFDMCSSIYILLCICFICSKNFFVVRFCIFINTVPKNVA